MSSKMNPATGEFVAREDATANDEQVGGGVFGEELSGGKQKPFEMGYRS